MSLYGGSLRSYSMGGDKYSPEPIVEFTESELLEIANLVCEGYENSEDNTSEEPITEGANIEYTKAFMASKKKFKECVKSCKKNIKAKDFKAAKSNVKDAKVVVKELEKTIKSTDSTVGSAVFGYFASGYINMFQILIPLGVTGLGGGVTVAGAALQKGALAALGLATQTIGIITTYVKAIIVIIKDITQFCKDIDEKTSAANTLNLYRNKVLQFTADMSKSLDKLEKVIDAREKEGK